MKYSCYDSHEVMMPIWLSIYTYYTYQLRHFAATTSVLRTFLLGRLTWRITVSPHHNVFPSSACHRHFYLSSSLIRIQSSNPISSSLIVSQILSFISDLTRNMNSKRDRIPIRRVSRSVSRGNGNMHHMSDSRHFLDDSWDEGSFQVLPHRENVDRMRFPVNTDSQYSPLTPLTMLCKPSTSTSSEDSQSCKPIQSD